jgi:hypothetical protein
LTRRGFKLDENTKQIIENGTESQKAAAIIKYLTGTYGGMNAAMRETSAGRLVALKNSWSDLKEQIGGQLLPVFEKAVKVMGDIVDKFSEISPETKGFILKTALAASASMVLGGGLMFLAGSVKSLMIFGEAAKAIHLFNSAGTASIGVMTGMATAAAATLVTVAGLIAAEELLMSIKGIGQSVGASWNSKEIQRENEAILQLVQEGKTKEAEKRLKKISDAQGELNETVGNQKWATTGMERLGLEMQKIKDFLKFDIKIPEIKMPGMYDFLDDADALVAKIEKAADKTKESFGFALREIIGAYEYIPEWMNVQSRMMGPELKPFSLTPAFAGAAGPGVKQVNLQFNLASRSELHDRIDRELDREGL